jgi:hypothetical protein
MVQSPSGRLATPEFPRGDAEIEKIAIEEQEAVAGELRA